MTENEEHYPSARKGFEVKFHLSVTVVVVNCTILISCGEEGGRPGKGLLQWL